MQTKILQEKSTHWPSIFILMILAAGLLFTLGLAFVMGLASIISLFDNSSPPVDNMIIAFSAGCEFILLLACAWFVLQRTMGNESANDKMRFPFAAWQVLVIPLVMITFISIGGVIAFSANKYLTWLFLPVATLLVVIPPIFLYIGIGSHGIEAGPRWRIWGTIGLGLTLSPVVMIILEVIVLLMGLGIVLIFLAFQPNKLQELQSFVDLLNRQTNEDVVLKMLGPYLTDPRVLAGIFGYIALIVPLIEELFKPLAVWLFALRIEKPSQGFVLGMLSGGTFALIESLNASADGSESWPMVVGVRAGTSLLHIALSGLMGYAIVGAFKEKRIGQLFATYFTVVIIHGIWNASAIVAGLSANGEAIGRPEWFANFLPASVCGISVLAIGMLAVILASNRRIRSTTITTSISLPAEDKE